MYEELVEPAFHAVLLVCYSALTVLLTAASAIVEYRSYLIVSSGDFLLAGWEAVIGLVILVFAYFMLSDKAMAEYRHLTE